MNNKKTFILMIIFITLAVAINVFIIVEAGMSGSNSAAQSSWVADIIAKVFHITPDENFHHIVRKLVGHFSLYVVDGVFTTLAIYYSFKYKNIYKIKIFLPTYLLLGVVLASVSEFVQLLALNRGFAFVDMLINYSGYFLGGGVVFLITFFINIKCDCFFFIIIVCCINCIILFC